MSTDKLRSTLFAGALAAALVAPPAAAIQLDRAPDNSWVRITGTVVSTTDDAFTLDYGEGSIVVEMDDYDDVKEGRYISTGHDVIVYGRVDNDLLTMQSIEAESVYVQQLDRYIHASSQDEEDLLQVEKRFEKQELPDGSYVMLTGTVTAIDGREFILHTGKQEIRVDTAGMQDDPLDQLGHLRLKVGDQVILSGRLGKDFVREQEIDANVVLSWPDAAS